MSNLFKKHINFVNQLLDNNKFILPVLTLILLNSYFFNSFLLYQIEPMLNFWEDRVYGQIDQTFKFYIENKDIPKFFVFTELKCGLNKINDHCIWPGNYLGHIVFASYFLPLDLSDLDKFEQYFDIVIKISYLIIIFIYSFFILKNFNLSVLKIYIIFISFSPYFIAWASRHHEIVSVHLLLGVLGFVLGHKFLFQKKYIYLSIIFILSFLSCLTKFDYFVILASSSFLPVVFYGLKNKISIKVIGIYSSLCFLVSIFAFLSSLIFQSSLISYFYNNFGVTNLELEFFNNNYFTWLFEGRVSERTTLIGIFHQLNLLMRNLSISVFTISIFDLISAFSIFTFCCIYLIIGINQFSLKNLKNLSDIQILIICSIIQLIFIFVAIYINYGGLNHLQEEIILYFTFLPLLFITIGLLYNKYKNFILEYLLNMIICVLFIISFHTYLN